MKIIGVITLWNVLEVVLGEPIISADDVYAEFRHKVEVGKVKLVRTHSSITPQAVGLGPAGSINMPPPFSSQPPTAEDTPLLSGQV